MPTSARTFPGRSIGGRRPLNETLAKAAIRTSVRLERWLTLHLLMAASSLLGQLQPSGSPRADFWITDGPVYSIIETNGVIYLGGSFSALSPNREKTALLDVVA